MYIIEVTESEVQKNKDAYDKRTEAGEVFLVKRADGSKYMMVPQDPSRIDIPVCDI